MSWETRADRENKPDRGSERSRNPTGQTRSVHFPSTSADRAELLEAAIARLTRALVTASDDTIADLVAERRAMRAELEQLHQDAGGVVRLDEERARRTPKR